MAISITVKPLGAMRAQVSRADGVVTYIEPGDEQVFSTEDGAPAIIVEEVALA